MKPTCLHPYFRACGKLKRKTKKIKINEKLIFIWKFPTNGPEQFICGCRPNLQRNGQDSILRTPQVSPPILRALATFVDLSIQLSLFLSSLFCLSSFSCFVPTLAPCRRRRRERPMFTWRSSPSRPSATKVRFRSAFRSYRPFYAFRIFPLLISLYLGFSIFWSFLFLRLWMFGSLLFPLFLLWFLSKIGFISFHFYFFLEVLDAFESDLY